MKATLTTNQKHQIDLAIEYFLVLNATESTRNEIEAHSERLERNIMSLLNLDFITCDQYSTIIQRVYRAKHAAVRTNENQHAARAQAY